MVFVSSIERVWRYRRQHGTGAMFRRLGTTFARARFMGLQVLFSCELPVQQAPENLPAGVMVERKKNLADVSAEDFARIVSHCQPTARRHEIEERYIAGAEMWLARYDGVIAGYGWTLRGGTVAPHFFHLLPTDVHLFDFFVFPEFRGRRINPTLVWQILLEMGRAGADRAWIEVAAWNRAQLSSLEKTPFRRAGAGRKICVGSRAFTFWSQRPLLNPANREQAAGQIQPDGVHS
jgi:ribosomal protein S18 acetylase RimI-like enzyme